MVVKCSQYGVVCRSLLKDDPVFYVPEVIWDLTTKNVLTTELVNGESLDKVETRDQQQKNWVGD
jgi:aarF domain-containing kinase